ncbi:MAG: endolytic transglycosylase MltG, partial [Rhizobacter sp.]|nr:endolytic transglycosylase MltG [Rhizobacter sp.]
MKRWGRALLVIVVMTVVVAGALALAAAWWLQRPLPLASDTVELSIEPGETPRQIAQAWVDAGVQAPPWMLYEWFRWSGQARRIRAGSYEIDRLVSPQRLLQKMVLGDETLAVTRIIEGWNFRQLRAELARAERLKPTIAELSDAEVMALISAPGISPEGQFFPDTYAYSKGSSDIAVLKRAHHAMQRRLAAAWEARAPDTPL